MKKLFSSRFLLILASSLITLIVLIVGAFYLFDDNDSSFIKSGYVLNPLSSDLERYFFDKDSGYKENLSSMIEFVDTDNNKVSILKDSFIHYTDESISFLKNGAILDLDSVNGNNAVLFYNITSDSIITKDSNGYLIKSVRGDIRLKNFIGRISDDKYIIVGDLSLGMAGNSTNVVGDYFEIVYVEEGIVNIENKDIKYQVTADDTIIYVGSDKQIDLGEKSVKINDLGIMSITSITIDGDENIEIVPKDEKVEEPGNDGNEGDNNGLNNGNNNNPGDGIGGNGNLNGGDALGNDGNEGNTPPDDSQKEEIVVSLKDSKIGKIDISVVFDIVNAKEEDNFIIQVVNLNTGRTIDRVPLILKEDNLTEWAVLQGLTPNTKYLFMVINEKDNVKYFQKVFLTLGFGIKLEQAYTTDSALAYRVLMEGDSDITNATLSLYKYNEETNKLEVVKNCYTVEESLKCVEKTTKLSDLNRDGNGNYEILYDGLESNTVYTAVLDQFSTGAPGYGKDYNITMTSMTLKKTPSFGVPIVNKDNSKGTFDLSISKVIDPDSAIIDYTYKIYDVLTGREVISPIEKTNASPITVKIGDKENELKADNAYSYMVVIEYFDNEKYIEYVATDKVKFLMESDPYVVITANQDLISYDKIGATIKLTDNSCLISMPDREKCDAPLSLAMIEVWQLSFVDGSRVGDAPVFIDNYAKFQMVNDELLYNLNLDRYNLQAGTKYEITVKAKLNNNDSEEYVELIHEGDRVIETKYLSSFDVDWTDLPSSANHVINTTTKFVAEENSSAVSGEESASAIKKIVARLYGFEEINKIDEAVFIEEKTFVNTNEFNIKENFYDNSYVIFDYNAEDLKSLTEDGKLSHFYKIVVDAYYDLDGNKKINLTESVWTYKISEILFLDEIEEPTLTITPISKAAAIEMYNDNNLFKRLNGNTTVAYMVEVGIDGFNLRNNHIEPDKINFYVYNDRSERIKFYTDKELSNLTDTVSVDLDGGSYAETIIFLDHGTDYLVVDDIMRRGNDFYIGYVVDTIIDGDEVEPYPSAKDENSPSDFGLYEKVSSLKEKPDDITMFISKSDNNSVTYTYKINDPDNAIYKENGSSNYGIYTNVNETGEVKIDLVKKNGDYNKFEGKFTITGLSNKDLYSLYLKVNLNKAMEVSLYDKDSSDGRRLFDGYYDIANYSVNYEIINRPLVDNKVLIKINANDEIVDRILNYKVKFTDSKGTEPIEKNFFKLSSCGNGIDNRCMIIDYNELKSMKSRQNETNLISVSVLAIYDNGLTGFDYINNGSDYEYFILQNNNTENGMGKYISYSKGGQITLWSELLNAPIGYYTTSTFDGSLFTYISALNNSFHSNIKVSLTSNGYFAKNLGVINPKMLSSSMITTTNNTFSFSSITPKVDGSLVSPLLNGTVQRLTLYSANLEDFKNDGNANNPKYNVYIEVWDNIDDVGDLTKTVRPSISSEIPIDDSTTKIIDNIIIDGLDTGKKYYYYVYANMYKNNVLEYVKLFSNEYNDRYDYKYEEFTTYSPGLVYNKKVVDYYAKEISNANDDYGRRELRSIVYLTAHEGSVPFNFDIVYALCDMKDSLECGIDSNSKNIFTKTIETNGKRTTDNTTTEDITEYDLEFGKNYRMNIYAVVDYYENGVRTKKNILLNESDFVTWLRELRKPTFAVTRMAGVVNGEYYIDFGVSTKDIIDDQTLINGNYSIKLLKDNEPVGNIQIQDTSGNYHTVGDDYKFSVRDVGQIIRITGLDPDTEYQYVVYGDSYLNNYNTETLPGIDNRTVPIKNTDAVYSSNDYGISFGKNVVYSATEKSIIVTFFGGSSFDNVYEATASVSGIWNYEEGKKIISKTYNIEDGEIFSWNGDSDAWRFVIDLGGVINQEDKPYEVTLSFKIRVPLLDVQDYPVLSGTGENKIDLFNGTAVYSVDEKKQ